MPSLLSISLLSLLLLLQRAKLRLDEALSLFNQLMKESQDKVILSPLTIFRPYYHHQNYHQVAALVKILPQMSDYGDARRVVGTALQNGDHYILSLLSSSSLLPSPF